MSNFELCVSLLDGFTDAQLSNVASMLKIMKKMIDDALAENSGTDNIFVQQSGGQFPNDLEKSESPALEECMQEWGLA